MGLIITGLRAARPGCALGHTGFGLRVPGCALRPPQPSCRSPTLKHHNAAGRFDMARFRTRCPLELARLAPAGGGGTMLRRGLASSSRPRIGHGTRDHDLKVSVLESALGHVPRHGWSSKALCAGAEEQQLSGSAIGMFDRGAIELVEFFASKCDAAMVQQLSRRTSQEDLMQMPVRQRIAFIVRLRLEMLVPMLNHWPQAMALQSRLGNLPGSMCRTSSMVDSMWVAAGSPYTSGQNWDDHNHHVKRLLVASVYTSTELFMLTDRSPAQRRTWGFLDSRVEDALHIAMAVAQAERAARLTLNGFSRTNINPIHSAYHASSPPGPPPPPPPSPAAAAAAPAAAVPAPAPAGLTAQLPPSTPC